MIFQASSQRKSCRSTRMRISSATARLGWVSLSWIAALCGEAAQLAVGREMALHQILQRGRDEEIFLAQPQLAARPGSRRSDRGLCRSASARACSAQRADMVAGVEDVEPQRIGRARRPQPQRVDVLAAPADDRRVVGDRLDGFGRMPDRAVAAAVVDMLDAAAEMHVVDHLRPLRIPRGCRSDSHSSGYSCCQPLRDDLAEQAVIVADAVADRPGCRASPCSP